MFKKRRQRKKQKRRAAVAHGAQDRGQQVIQKRERNAQKDDEQVGVGVVEDLRRGGEQVQNLRAEQRAGCRQQHGNAERQRHAVKDQPPHRAVILRAKRLRNRDGEAAACACAEADDQKLDAARRADRGQCVRAEIAADDRGIGHVVGLLKQVAQQERKCERRISGSGRPCVMLFMSNASFVKFHGRPAAFHPPYFMSVCIACQQKSCKKIRPFRRILPVNRPFPSRWPARGRDSW